MQRSEKQWASIVGACQDVAMRSEHGRDGVAHTVTRMLREPAFRDRVIDDAMHRTDTYEMVRPSKGDYDDYKIVRAAAQVLAPHTGKVL